MHPTVKPVALIADAMRDCSRRRSIILDAFAGSGSTIMAAEQIGRRAFCLEIDPRYVDVAISRWQRFTRKDAVLESQRGDVRGDCRNACNSSRRPAMIERIPPKRWRSYKVGYRNPPTETQFKPGTSGNPKGRPKGTRQPGAILRSIIEQRVSVTENGKTRRIPTLEVAFRRLVGNAMRGDDKAIKLLVSLVDRYGEYFRVSKFKLDDLLAEDRDILTQYLPDAPLCPSPPDGRPTRESAEMPTAARRFEALLDGMISGPF